MPLSHRLGHHLAAASICLFTAACADAPISAPDASLQPRLVGGTSFSSASGRTAADHVVIQTRGVESSELVAAVAAAGGQVERRLPQTNLIVVKGLNAAGIAALAARGDVASVTSDVRIRWIPERAAIEKLTLSRPATTVTGPDQSGAFFYDFYQWNMRQTSANLAWTTTPAGSGATVYVLDTGIDPGHLDLAGLVDESKSKSFAEFEPDDFLDFNSHGTFVSALIASNGFGMASVAPLAKLVGVKVLDASGSGSFVDVIEGIMYAADQGADVINMSLGALADMSFQEDHDLVEHLQAAITYARNKGTVIVAAAGNSALNLATLPSQLMFVPAELAGVISVGATAPVNQENFDLRASYSNFGFNGAPRGGGVQVFAPGGDLVAEGDLDFGRDLILSACSQYVCGDINFYFLGAGTSFASPMVAGEAAVNRSILGAPSSFRNIACVLQGTDNIGARGTFGNGRMNVVKSAACASSSTVAARVAN